MPMEEAESTSYDQQPELIGNESPESIVLCSTSTLQLAANDGSMENLQDMPRVSSSNIPFGSPQQSNNQDNGTSSMNDSFDDGDGDDDDVIFVDEVKREPLDIQNEPSTSVHSHQNDLVSFEPVSMAQLIPPSDHQDRRDAEEFGRFVAQRLTKLPDKRSRRKLENSIQAAILDVELQSFQ